LEDEQQSNTAKKASELAELEQSLTKTPGRKNSVEGRKIVSKQGNFKSSKNRRKQDKKVC
jgi:hypothetical protein